MPRSMKSGNQEADVSLLCTCREWFPPEDDPNCPMHGDGPVLGYCPHGVNLDREFCPQGCRV